MATLTPIDRERMNPREANILEEARLRKVAIQNMQRDNLEAQAIWRDKQMKSYGNLIPITEETPLSKIITDEKQAQSQDEFLQKQHAMANLATIADPPNVEYIIDRLNLEQMRWLNDNWVGLLRNIKKKNSRMDKNVFVNEIVAGEANGTSYEDAFAGAPTAAMQQSQDMRATAAANVAGKLQQQRDAEEARQQAEEEGGLSLNAERSRLQNIAALTARNQAKTSRRSSLLAALRAQVTPPPSPAQSNISEALSESNLSAGLQAKQDARLALTAGGSQNVVSPLTQIGPTVGNIVFAGTSGVVAPPPPGLVRGKSSSSMVSDADIEKSIKIQPLTSKEESDYAGEIEKIKEAVSKMSTVEVKTKLNKILGKTMFSETIGQLKQLTNISKINEDIYKRMYVLAEIEKLRGNTGSGLIRKKRLIRGRGYMKHEHPTKKPRRHYIGETFYVDLNKLDDSILCVKYASNDSNLPRLRVQQITQKTAEIIRDILNSKYDERIFKLLSADEKRMVRRFVKAVKLDIDTSDDEEKEFQRQFEICRGEYLSGNDSPQIKAALKRYVLEALQENKIARNDGYNLLFSLSV